MPSSQTPSVHEQRLDAPPSDGQRFTRALVALTRAIWHPDCSFDSALALICEIAADALRVDRVNVWHYDRDARRLRCIHAFSARERAHAGGDTLESLSLEGDDYVAGFEDVRALDAADVRLHPSTASSLSELRSYLEHHGIHALLDAQGIGRALADQRQCAVEAAIGMPDLARERHQCAGEALAVRRRHNEALLGHAWHMGCRHRYGP